MSQANPHGHREKGGAQTHDVVACTLELPPGVVGLEDGERVAAEVGGRPRVLDAVGLLLHEGRAQERVAVGEDGGEREGLVEAAEEAPEEAQLANGGLDGELEQDAAQARQLLVAVDGADVEERLERGHDARGLGRLDRRRQDVKDGQARQLQARDVHGRRREVGAEHLDRLVDVHGGEPRLGHDAVVLARAVTTGAAGTLEHVARARPRADELRQAPLRVVPLLLALGRVDDVDDVGDRDRRLGNVGRQDDAADALGRGLKDGLLLGDGDGRVQHVDLDVAAGKVHVEERVPVAVEEDVAHRLDLVPPGEEDEDVALVRARHDVRDDERQERVRHLEVVDLADGAPRARVHRDGRDELALQVGHDRLVLEDPPAAVGGQPQGLELLDRLVEPALLDRERAAGHLDDGRDPVRVGVGKVASEEPRVDRRRPVSTHECERGPRREGQERERERD